MEYDVRVAVVAYVLSVLGCLLACCILFRVRSVCGLFMIDVCLLCPDVFIMIFLLCVVEYHLVWTGGQQVSCHAQLDCRGFLRHLLYTPPSLPILPISTLVLFTTRTDENVMDCCVLTEDVTVDVLVEKSRFVAVC